MNKNFNIGDIVEIVNYPNSNKVSTIWTGKAKIINNRDDDGCSLELLRNGRVGSFNNRYLAKVKKEESFLLKWLDIN